MKRYNKRRLAQEEAALDLTPMMDIVFIMLIFFIVTTSFVKETELTLIDLMQKLQKEMKRVIYWLQ